MNFTSRSVFADSMLFWIQNINDTLYAFGRDFEDTNKFFIAFSIDTGKVWQNVYSFKIEDIHNINRVIYLNGNLFISYVVPTSDTTMKLVGYSYSFRKKLGTQIFDKEISGIMSIYKISDTYYIRYYHYGEQYIINGVIANNNFENDPTNWEEFPISNERFFIFDIFPSKDDSILAIVAQDMHLNTPTILFAKEKQFNPVVETPTIEKLPLLYISQPHPNPTRNATTMRVYYNSQFDIEQANFRVYNLIGMQVSGKESFSLSRINHYTTDVTWRFDGLPSGVYLVVISLAGETQSKVIVAE